VTQRNRLLERQIKLSKSEFSSLTEENARLKDENDSSGELATAALPIVSGDLKDTPLAVANPIAGLVSEPDASGSAFWPVKYWILGMLGIGLVVGLAVAWLESNDPKRLRQSATKSS